MGDTKWMITLTRPDGDSSAYFFKYEENAQKFYEAMVTNHSMDEVLREYWVRKDYPVSWERVKYY